MNGVIADRAKLLPSETVMTYARDCSSIETGDRWFELPAEQQHYIKSVANIKRRSSHCKI
ncbi:MAG: hypothetical protein ACPL7I_05625 [Myxococcota bacterium]